MQKLLALTLVTLFAATVLVPAAPAADKPPIKIGFIAPKTGNFAQFGIDMLDGFKLYLNEIDYTIAGRKVEVIEEDEGSTPANAVSKARKLITHDKVQLIAGLFFAAAAYAVAPVVQEAEVPLVITAAATKRPTTMLTLSWVISLRIFVTAIAGWAPSSSSISSILRPATW